MSIRFTRLTRPAIRALSAGEKISEHGITAERQSNGDCRYSINIMVDGQRIHRVVGRESEGVTREQAERTIEGLRTKAREGRLDLPTGRKLHRSFTEAASEYLIRIKPHTKHGRNYARKKHHMDRYLVPYFKQHRPDKLTDFAIAHYVRNRKDKGAAVATINRELSTLSHFLSRCIEWHWIKTKPSVPKGEEPRKKIVLLNASDQRALMQAAIGDQDPHLWLFVAIALGTGMRHSEILRIRWEDIDSVHRRIHIAKAKAGQREQPMPPSLAVSLERERERLSVEKGWLFPTSRADTKHPHRVTMSPQFKRAVERAKLDPAKVTPHVLRHTAITGLVKAGVDLPTIQRISGHKTLAMVLRYTQLTDDHIDKSVAKMDGAFLDAITPKIHMPTNEAERGVA